ncbi:MAG: hypothetical protein ACTHNW_18765 [Mucilaginibacter sp.]
MKTLQAKYFPSANCREVTQFVAANNINREDILIITSDDGNYTLFYYA